MNKVEKRILVPGDADPRGGNRVRTARRLNDHGYVEELVNMEDCMIMATEDKEKQLQAALDHDEELVRRLREVQDTFDFLIRNVKEPVEEYIEFAKDSLVRIRDQKMALQAETRAFMNSLREVREFFLEEKHEEEVRRLLEFVELCERLKRLKESGFLDTVADTMLKLSDK